MNQTDFFVHHTIDEWIRTKELLYYRCNSIYNSFNSFELKNSHHDAWAFFSLTWETIIKQIENDTILKYMDKDYPSRFSPYFYTIYWRKINDEYRKTGKTEIIDNWENIPDEPEPIPLDNYRFSEEEKQSLSDLIELTPKDCPQMLRMRLQGLSYKEIAEKTQYTEVKAKERVRYCRKCLAKLVKAEGLESDDISIDS